MEKRALNILKFLNELERLKSVTRHSWTSSGRQESVAEHSWRMVVMAMVLEDEFPKVNIGRVIEMVAVHDFGEIYDGDTPAFTSDPNKLEREKAAIKKLVSSLNFDLQQKIIGLWDEYNKCETQEAKLAKALDKLEVLIQHNEADLSTWIPHEYEFNLIYGKEFTEFDEFIKIFRKLVDSQTKLKISEKPLVENDGRI